MLLFPDTGTAPARVIPITLTAGNVNGSKGTSRLGDPFSHKPVWVISIPIARGTIQGSVSGLCTNLGSNNYLGDKNVLYTQSQLQGFIEGGDTLSFMGVFPGRAATSRSFLCVTQ